MATINQRLIEALKKELGVSQTHVYRRIAKTASKRYMSRDLAAIALAADSGINVARFATNEQLKELRGGNSSGAGSEPIHLAPPINMVAPRSNGKARARATGREKKKGRGTSVFVVHGRNEKLRQGLFSFLRAVGLDPIEWREAIALTKKASPYVGEILEAAFRKAIAVVVLLTPDDQARLRSEFVKKHDAVYEKTLTGQARPNVLFEAGMAMGRNEESTVLVQVGELRPFSDVVGRHVVHLSNSATSRQEFVTKLENAGCQVKTSGSDWLKEGDFEL